MYKQSPSRNQRSKGIKVKHILQICVLVAVCFWLLYQVKHSHEKRKEFESQDEKVVEKLKSDSELQRFGRKDIPRVTEIATNVEKHVEDDDDKEDEEEDKENKHEEDEIDREDSAVGDSEEERGGDDEIDEDKTEKTEEEEVDEDKEGEENHGVNEDHEDIQEEGHLEEEEEEESGKEGHIESEESDDIDKEDHGEREITSDDHNHDHEHDVERNTRKAQEELYRADDASSEVAHNVQSIISQENDNITLGQANEIYRKINFGQEHDSNTSQESVKPETQPREDINSTSSNATITEQKSDKVNLTKADDKPEIPNNTTVIGDKNQLEAGEDANKSENVYTNKTLASSHASNDNETLKIGEDGEENSESHTSEGNGAIQDDPIDASDTDVLTREERESSTDLDTLPDIKNEVRDRVGVVAE